MEVLALFMSCASLAVSVYVLRKIKTLTEIEDLIRKVRRERVAKGER